MEPGPGGPDTPVFSGNFDGDGHAILNLRVNAPQKNELGLFGASRGVIENLAVTCLTTGSYYVGALVGANSGRVINCSGNGSVSGHTGVGGLVGSNAGRDAAVAGCTFSGTVNGKCNVGGLVGYNHAALSNSFANAITRGQVCVGALA